MGSRLAERLNATPVDVREVARDFVEREISPELARQIDQKDVYPHDLLRAFSETGLFGLNISEEYGGMGRPSVDTLPIYEELSRRLPVLAWVIGNIMLYGNEIIGTNGDTEQKQHYLPALARGELHFSFALTEPEAGSDAANVSTRAEFRDGCYWITGSKIFITGAGVSDFVVTIARTAPSRYRGLTAFLVNSSLEGFSARPFDKLGYRGSNTCEVHYENVKVAPGDILGGEECLNQGWSQMTTLLNSERLALAACALGIGQGALDAAISYAKSHFPFARATGRYQSVQHALVEMATELEAARRLTYHAADLERKGVECLKQTSMAKYFATEMAKRIALRGVELLEADGGTTEFELQRFLRDVVALCIGGGTTEIQKNIVAKTMGLV
jgi:alkylation response protein AidB-like acyl-CoA dehydrogenase